MSQPMAKFRWRHDNVWMGSEHVLSVATKNSSKWYATLKYMSDRWHVTTRDWDFWLPLDYTDEENPPKEHVESLMLLAHDIGDING
jgi:hypothetical protein